MVFCLKFANFHIYEWIAYDLYSIRLIYFYDFPVCFCIRLCTSSTLGPLIHCLTNASNDDKYVGEMFYKGGNTRQTNDDSTKSSVTLFKLATYARIPYACLDDVDVFLLPEITFSVANEYH